MLLMCKPLAFSPESFRKASFVLQGSLESFRKEVFLCASDLGVEGTLYQAVLSGQSFQLVTDTAKHMAI